MPPVKSGTTFPCPRAPSDQVQFGDPTANVVTGSPVPAASSSALQHDQNPQTGKRPFRSSLFETVNKRQLGSVTIPTIKRWVEFPPYMLLVHQFHYLYALPSFPGFECLIVLFKHNANILND